MATKKKKAASRKSAAEKREYEKRVREYGEFLKDDADFDWVYIIRMLRYKLERTRRQILKDNIIEDARKVGKEIDEVARLLKRVEDDKYSDELHKPFYKKYGRPRVITSPSGKRGLTSITFKYPNETPAKRAAMVKEQRRLFKLEDQMRRQDLQKAFSLMVRNIWGWWD